MNKILLTGTLLLAFTGVVSAQGQKPKAPATTITCAVMPDMKVDIAKATKNNLFADLKGRRYYFCCSGCPSEFKSNPAKYAKSPSLPTPAKK